MPSSCFTIADAQKLKAALPLLSFKSQPVGIDAGHPVFRAYCQCYRLDFSSRFPGVSHSLGRISACGFEIATQCWMPANPKGTLLVIHGYYDHVGVYDKVVAFGLSQGLAVLAFDLPGHGLSSGEPVAIDSFDHYADVLEVIARAARPYLPAPWYGLGQSTGGAVLLNHLWRYEAYCDEPLLAQIALCAPLVLPRGWGRGRIAYSLLHRFLKTLPRGRSCSSHDPEFMRFIDDEDCLQSRYLSVKWVGAMKKWDADFALYPRLQRRLLIVQGTDDLTVAWQYNLQQIQAKLPLAEVVMIEGAGHQLVNERSDLREQVFSQISRFFFSA